MARRKRTRVLVLGGGPSVEHEVSLRTAEMIYENLDKKKYNPQLATITKDGRWLVPPFWPMSSKEIIPRIKEITDIVFLGLHGEFGEDGKVQELLEAHKIPFTGSDARASFLGMQKHIAKDQFRAHGLHVPNAFGFMRDVYGRAKKEILHIIASQFSFPVVVKPIDRGSSVGVSIIEGLSALEKKIHDVLHYSHYVLTEEFVPGIEISCGVFEDENGGVVPLLPTEIAPQKNSFFDYDSKYTIGGALEITPARIPHAIFSEVQRIAVRAHSIIGCRGYSRTDMIWDSRNSMIHILEINTLPGLTKESLIPKAALASGISLPELLDRIAESALHRS